MTKLQKTPAKVKSPRRKYRGLFVKLYIDSLNDPKIAQLDGESYKSWCKALMVSKPTKGVLPPLVELAFKMRLPIAETKSRMLTLVSVGLVDEEHVDGATFWSIHQWDKWQQDTSSADRMRRLRERRRFGADNQPNENTHVTHGDVTVTEQSDDVHDSYSSTLTFPNLSEDPIQEGSGSRVDRYSRGAGGKIGGGGRS